MNSYYYVSNRLECLTFSLKENLFSTGAPFSKKMVVVPSQNMKRHLMLELAKDWGVAAGIQFVTLSKALSELSKNRIPSFIELSLKIEQELPKIDEVKGCQFPQLADQIARYFIRCGMYGCTLEGWLKKLWDQFSFDLEVNEKVDFPIHIFGFGTLPEKYFQFFKKFQAQFYLLSPTQLFWSDLQSDKQRAYKEMDDALEGNRILANLGKLGRRMARLLEEEELNEFYDDEHLIKVQQALFNLEPYEEENSIQVHVAETKLHEVEVLYQNICALLKKGFEPKDIHVLVPDLEDYSPFIHMVFWEKIDYAIHQSHHAPLEALLHLLALPQLRFERSVVLKLFGYEEFLGDLSKNDRDLIKSWIQKAKILWGLNAAHRQSYLQDPLIEKSEEGTWQDGLDWLLEGLVTAPENEEAVEWTDAALFGKFAQVMMSLKDQLIIQGLKPFNHWAQFVKKIATQFLVLNETEQNILHELNQMEFSHELSFDSFKRVLEYLCKKNAPAFQSSHLQAVQFFSLRSASAIPSKVIFVLGLQEESFPRSDKWPAICPRLSVTSLDEDRHHFLEVLLSVRCQLFLSYVKELPSSVINELKIQQINKHSLPQVKVKAHASFFDLKQQVEKEIIIDIKHLSLLARHPVQFYFNRVLGIYLDKEENEPKEFTLTPLNKAILRNSPHAKGLIPQGAFRRLALKRMAQEKEEFETHLKALAIDELSSHDVNLSIGNVTIIGKLKDISTEGLLVSGRGQISDCIKYWPQYLIYLLLPLEKKTNALLFTKGKTRTLAIDDPASELTKYLNYYEKCLNEVSFCMPDWTESILKGQELNTFMQFPDPYLEWLEKRDEMPDAEVINHRWGSFIKETYAIL